MGCSRFFAAQQQGHCRAIAMERSHVDVSFAGFRSERSAASAEIAVDERPEIFVASASSFPQRPQIAETRGRYPEGAPYPVRRRRSLFHLNFGDPVPLHYHGVEKFRMLDREKQKGQFAIR